jgi:hypothetical protein
MGAFVRGFQHRSWSWGPNLSQYQEHIGPWIIDGIWLFALVAAAVVGLRGRFSGARPTGVICAAVILTMATAGTLGNLLFGLVLAILVLGQLPGLLGICRSNRD